MAVAVVAVALALSACAAWKPGSYKASQPEQVNNVTLALVMCTKGDSLGEEHETCKPTTSETEPGEGGQQMLVFAVPAGSKGPDTIVSKPTTSGPSLVFTRNQEVVEAFVKAGYEGFPPPGHDLIGYLSNPYEEFKGMNLEWPISAEFSMPAPADGGAFGGPYNAWLATGFRYIRNNPNEQASRPVDCGENEGETTNCVVNEQLDLPVSDLRLTPPSASVSGTPGSTVSVPFALNFGSSVSAPPNFALSASTALAGAKVDVGPTTYIPTGIDPGTHRASPSAATVSIAIPAGAQPGAYDVSISAQAQPNGGKIVSTAKLQVVAAPPPAKATLKLGKLTRNLKQGTAQLAVVVSAPGVVTLAGKKIQKGRKVAKGPGQVKLTLRARGKAKKALGKQGKAKVKATVTFAPTGGGSASVASRSVLLKKSR
ncbi:MAG TPA: hypothetical protein VLC07_00380 [Solirubrobacterales bacterium]|nr:hypothetical protein [Solirubrobacterales bacterium]